MLRRAFSEIFNPILFSFYHFLYTSLYFLYKPALLARRSVTLPGASGTAATSFAYVCHFLFKHRTINQPTPQLRPIPCSLRRYNTHQNHYKLTSKHPTPTYAQPLHHNRSRPLQPHHHNRLNHSHCFNAFTTALPSPHYNRHKCHQPPGRSPQSLRVPEE